MVKALNVINNNQLVSMTQITIVEKEDYIILFIEPKSLDDHNGHHGSGP
jgi:hypothetical protein